MLTYLLTNALLAVALGGALLALVYCGLRWPLGLVGLLLAAWVATVALRDATSLSFLVSGFRISAMDVLAVVMAGIAIARFGSNGIRGVGGGLVLGLLALLAIHISRGVADFGFAPGVNSSRSALYFLAALAYAATVPGGWDRRVWKIFIAVGVSLAIVAVPFWLTGGLGSADTSIVRDGQVITSRPVVAAGALLILQAAVLALALRWPSRRSAMYLATGVIAIVVLLQHRTVWVAAAVIAVAGFLIWSRNAGRGAERTVFAVVGVALLLLPLAAFGLTRSDSLVRSVQEVRTEDSTLTWRTSGWQELVSSHDSATELATGTASGTPLDRRIDGRVVDVSAHSELVETYLRFGIPGVVGLALLGLLLWRRRARIGEGVGLPAAAVGLLLLTQLTFGLAYSLDAVQGVIAGILVGGLAVAPVPQQEAVSLPIAQRAFA